MWTDEKNALERLIDLKRVKARIETEAQQEEKAGQIHTTAEQKEYRLKVLDKLIAQSELEKKKKKTEKQGEVYR